MIFYFSGTGNSLYAAKRIALHNNEKLVSISSYINSGDQEYEYTLAEGEKIGFVFPIHAWAPPKMMLEFIRKLKLTGYSGNYTFAVANCAGNIGNTMKVLEAALKQKNLPLNGRFSVKMPNNYILMGNVEPEKAQKEKLAAAEETLKKINTAIELRNAGDFWLNKGAFAWLLTNGINPLFEKGAIQTDKFSVGDSCSGCGTCERVCNYNTIHLEGGKPKWDKNCTQCLACLHYCPSKAIQYGKATVKKGRYTNPQISVAEIAKR